MSDNKKDTEKVSISYGFTQTHFTILAVALAVAVSGLILFNGFATIENMASLIASQINGLAMFFATFFGLCFVLMGLKVNVYRELVDEHNIALAIFLAGLALAVSGIIARAAL